MMVWGVIVSVSDNALCYIVRAVRFMAVVVRH